MKHYYNHQLGQQLQFLFYELSLGSLLMRPN